MARPGLRLTLAAGTLACATLVGVGRADAHAILQSSEPASGAAVAASPHQIVLDFNESVQFDLGGLTLVDAAGGPVAIGATQHRPGTDDVIEASVPSLAPGVYVVGYRVVSADGHPVSGNVVFRVGAGSVAGVVAHGHHGDLLVGEVYGVLRFAAYPALVIVGGALLFALLVWPPLWWRSRRTLLTAAAALSVASFAQFAVAVPYLQGSEFGAALHASKWADVARTDLGRWLLLRAVLGVLLVGSLLKVGRWRVGRSTGLSIAGLLFAGLTVTVVGDGHAAAGRWLVLGWLSTAVHIAAMCCWLAGLGVLALGMRRHDHDLLDAVRGRWSRTAAWAVVAIVGSGVVQAWRLLPDAHSLSSTYGRLLIAKTVLVGAMLLLGNLGRRTLLRAVGDKWPSALRRSVAVELAVGLAVVAVTTVLVQTEPGTRPSTAAAASSSNASSTPSGTEWSTTLRLGERSMTVTLDGTTTGRHRMTLVVDDAAQPFADPVSLDARLTLAAKGLGPIPVLFGTDSRLHWSTDALELPAAGRWRLELFVIDSSTKARFATTLDITDAGAP